METAARTVESHLTLALLQCSLAQLEVRGVSDDGYTPCDSWAASRILVQVRLPLSEPTVQLMAARLRDCGMQDVTVTPVLAHLVLSGTLLRNRQMLALTGYVTDATAISSIRFEFSDTELAAVARRWRQARMDEDAEYAARDNKPSATCKHCATEFHPTSGSAGMFCSTSCHNQHRRAQGAAGIKQVRARREPPAAITCVCGSVFIPKLRSGGSYTKSCSRACGMKIRAATIRARQAAAQSR